MPLYRYNGNVPFRSVEYNINVNPGEEFTTTYILPSTLTDFELLDLNVPEPILPHTESYNVDSPIEIDLFGYTALVILLRNSNNSILKIHCYSLDSNPIILDNFVNYWVVQDENLYQYFQKIYLDTEAGTPDVIVYKGIIGSDYGALGVGSGGSGGGCLMETTDPVPTTHGGLSAGTDINGMSACQVLQMILYPYQYPAFSSFYIEGQSTNLEVGDIVTGGNRIFRWSTTNNQNIQPNTIKIDDVTGGSTLANNLANDGNETLDIGSDKTRNTAGSYTWRISALNTKGGTFSRNFTVSWQYRKYWGYNSNDTLTENDIKNLQHSQLSSTYTGSYNYTNPGSAVYYYVVYPDSWGDFSTWVDSDTNFQVDYTRVSNVDVTNDFGITITYRVYRTTYLQNGDLNSQIT